MLKGRIIKGINGFYYVNTDNGVFECKARGIFRKKRITPLVGDMVSINVVDETKLKGVIEEIDKRDTELIRPPIANVSKAIIVFAIKNPDPNLSLLDRFIVLAEREHLETVIVLNKIDLDDENKFEIIKTTYEKAGYKVIPVSTKSDMNIDVVKGELSGNIVVFAGPSGVGKSSLLNKIDKSLSLETGEVSEKIKRGKHTTRYASLMEIDDGLVADTPGFSSLSLDICEDELKDYFIEFYNPSRECEYRDCLHENEINCGVKNALTSGKICIDRYNSYLQLLKEIRQTKRRY